MLISYLPEEEDDARETARWVEQAGRGDREHDVDPVEGSLAQLLAYAATKGAISNSTAALAQMLVDRGIRVNAVAPGPIWTPLIPSTMPAEKAASFGQQTPVSRAGQPKELAPAIVLLASDEASYMSGAVVPVTAGNLCCVATVGPPLSPETMPSRPSIGGAAVHESDG
jgi:NAD(P)-dependent dehydrogenase (short-subunit alcohol dehydrogenase family)